MNTITLPVCWLCPLSLQSVENLPTVFGSNSKAQTAAKTVFDLAHRHGNILREGWKNIMDSMLQLFRAELLPKAMVEVSTPFLNSEHSFPFSHWLDDICFVMRLPIQSVGFWIKERNILHVLLPPTGHWSDTVLVASGGGFCGAKWENFSSKRRNALKSVCTKLI